MAFVTVIIPVYNAKGFLPRCFGSLLAQTCPDWQAILVDDGSTDGSGAVCDEYAARDARFTALHQPNGGVCRARNQGLARVQTRYALLMDQDDALSPFALAAAQAALAAHPEAFINLQQTGLPAELAAGCPDTPDWQLYTARQAALLYAEAPFPPPWCKLYSTELLRRKNVQFDEQIRDGYEDRGFVRDYLRAFWGDAPDAPALLIAPPLYFWEQENSGSVSHQPDKPLQPWHLPMFDGFLCDCLEKYRVPPLTMEHYMLEYIQTIAFGVSCLPKTERRAVMRHTYAQPEFARMLDYFKQNRFYSAFYLPFRWHWTALVAALSRSRLQSGGLYWRCYKLGRLVLPGWAEWKSIAEMPRQ